MESQDQPEIQDQPEVEVPPVVEEPRNWWKTPSRWPEMAREGIKQIPKLFLFLKGWRSWPRRIFALAWANKVMSLVVFLSGIAILMPVLTYKLYYRIQRQHGIGVPIKVEQVYSALERGDYAETKILAKQLMYQKGVPAADAGVAPFVLGAVAVFEAEKMKGKDRLTQYLLASRYLEEANADGFPEAHCAEGLFLYGKSLYEIGAFAKCRTMLLKAMKAAPQHKSEIYSLLADAYLNESKPNLAEALSQNALFLADKKLPAADRQQGLLRKARIQLRMDQLDPCRATLKEIPENANVSAAVGVIGGQVLMREAELLRGKDAEIPADRKPQYDEKYQAAIKTFRLAETCAAAGSEATRQAMYLIGVCLMKTGDARAASDQFIRLHKIYPDTPEAQRHASNKRNCRGGRATIWKCSPNIAACWADSTSRSCTTIRGFRSRK